MLRINPRMGRTVSLLLEILLDSIPWCRTHILQDDDGRSMFCYPIHHATESTSRLSLGVNVLLDVVQVGIIDARRPGNQQINIPGNWGFSAIGGMSLVKSMKRLHRQMHSNARMILAKFTNIPEQEWRVEITLNISLLEGFYFAGENMLKFKIETV